ncbi:helix-turn-helix domain-containing protein [Rhizobium sp. BT-226]|uniref:helix-turn-helix domain-containing protein n=1 Tax=Rhizobium sp. BT-226 TaxID=2986922 RepID=UPI003558B0C7
MRNGAKIPDVIDVEVGSRIRLQRKVKGMTQQALAAALGITFQQVQKYEKGSNRVGASRLSDIAQALDVPVSYFFAGSQAATEDGTDPQSRREIDEVALFLTSNDGVNLNRAFMKIPSPAVRQKVVSLVKSLAMAADEAR